MAIGDAVKKYLAAKDQAAPDEMPAETPAAVETEPAAKAPTMAQVLMEFAQLLKQAQASQGQEQQHAMLQQADVLKQLLIKTKPENVTDPERGVYTYPEGNIARPKPTLKYPITWVGYKETEETLTPAEIEALNSLKPGVFQVTKSNGKRIEFRVTAIHNTNLEVERVDVWFPCKGEDRSDHASKISYCQQAMGVATPNVDDLMAQLETMKRALAAQMAPA